MKKERVEFMCDRIEAVLQAHRVPARVAGGTVTGRWVSFQVLPTLGTKISKIGSLSEELAAALDVPNCRVSRRGAAVAIEVPRDDPQPVRLLPLFHQLSEVDIPPVTATLGLSEDGAPLLIRLPSPDVAHILVAGTTGSGKTTLLQAMILSLAMATQPGETALVLVDLKGSAFSAFGQLPHLARPIIRDVGEATEALNSLVLFMEKRGRLVDNRQIAEAVEKHEGIEPRIILVIDELADLLMVGGREVRHALTRLTQRGREAGIHVVAATQKPTSAVLGPLVKANFPVRLVGKVMSTEDARVATGLSGTGAGRLMGRGDFLAIAEGKITRFQAAHISAQEIRETVAQLAAANPSRHHRPVVPATTPAPALKHRALSPSPVNAQAHQVSLLVSSPIWKERHGSNGYKWGFLTKACQVLFDRELAGTWDRQTRRIVALAEQISTTTTQNTLAGPQGGAIPPLAG